MDMDIARNMNQHHGICNLSNHNLGQRHAFSALQLVRAIQIQALLRLGGGETLLTVDRQLPEDDIVGEGMGWLGQGLGRSVLLLLSLVGHHMSVV
jgi:hypothetical protein